MDLQKIKTALGKCVKEPDNIAALRELVDIVNRTELETNLGRAAMQAAEAVDEYLNPRHIQGATYYSGQFFDLKDMREFNHQKNKLISNLTEFLEHVSREPHAAGGEEKIVSVGDNEDKEPCIIKDDFPEFCKMVICELAKSKGSLTNSGIKKRIKDKLGKNLSSFRVGKKHKFKITFSDFYMAFPEIKS
jgi:hypothetical protein